MSQPRFLVVQGCCPLGLTDMDALGCKQPLKARIQQEKPMVGLRREERTSKLVAWGVAVEQLLADDTFQADCRKLQCQRVLSGRTLERALVDDLTPREKYPHV